MMALGERGSHCKAEDDERAQMECRSIRQRGREPFKGAVVANVQ